MAELEVGDVVLCTVETVKNTIVFVRIDGTKLQGSIVTSEIAPGRIRNIRDYVVPKKKIVCKIIRINGNQINLSLRRVTPKEQKEVKEQYKLEKNSEGILKGILGDKAKEIISEIKKENSVYEFFQDSKENPKELEKLVGKENAEKILEILNTQKTKTAAIKKEIRLITTQPDGLKLIKEILNNIKNAEVKYISAGKYSVKTEDENMKKADQKLREILKDIEDKSKKLGLDFSVKEK